MESEAKITRDMMAGLQGVVPSTLATCSKDGMANATYISQVFYVDDFHVALSCQFMNKTWRNLQDNTVAVVIITCPTTFTLWKLKLRYLEAQTGGPVFEEMDMQLAAIATLHGVPESLFKIRAALICKVEQVKCLYNAQLS